MASVLEVGLYDYSNEAFNYVGNWGDFTKGTEKMTYSETAGNYVEFTFSGTGFKWYTHINAWRGYAKIYIDDIEKAKVDLYSKDEINNVMIYSSDKMENTNHKVKIIVAGEKNSLSVSYKVVIYKIEILKEEIVYYSEMIEEKEAELTEKEELLLSITGKMEEIQNQIEQFKNQIKQFQNQIEQLQNEIEKLKALQGEEIVEVTDLQVDDENIILYKAETHQLTWTVIPENATDKTVKFESGNTGFVTVTDTGLLTYVNEGETNINLTTSNNITKSVRVICKETNEENPDENNNIFQEDNDNTDYSKAVESENLYDEGIIIANEAEVLEIGDMIKIIAHVLPYSVYNTNPYVLKSSDESIVKVKGGKVIEAVSVGKAVITAYTTDGKYKNSVEYNVINKTEKTIDISKIYSLELDKFEIVADVSTKEQAIKNSDGIKSALYYAVNNGYEKIVFPSNLTIYIEPSETIYMESNLIVDLNNCIIKLRPNNYERYSAFYFGQGNGLNLVDNNFFNFSDAKYVDDFDPFNNITAKNPMYYKIFDFTSNNTITQYSKKIQIYSKSNKFNKLFDSLHYGDSINFSFRQLRYGNYSMNIQLQYYKDDTLILEEDSKSVSNSWTFSTPSFTFNLRNTVDYNNIQFKFVFTNFASPILYRKLFIINISIEKTFFVYVSLIVIA